MKNILGYFDRVKEKKSSRGYREWDAMCPAHDSSSRTRKLVITEKPEGYVFYCRSGCTHHEILNAAGLSWRDIKPESEVSARGPKFDTYHQALILIAEAEMKKGKVLSSGDRALYRDAIRRRAGASP
jgi:hypothetical protein